MKRAAITGVLLAGGQGRRMGLRDKGLLLLRGKPLAQRVLERLAPQVDTLLINANQNLECYAKLGAPFQAPVVTDLIPGFAGPLAGLQAALAHAATPLVLSVPCDAPFLPLDLAARLHAALNASAADLAIATTGTQPHPVFCLCRKALCADLAAYLASGGRQVAAWQRRQACIEVPFDEPNAAFMNLNTLADWQAAALSEPD